MIEPDLGSILVLLRLEFTDDGPSLPDGIVKLNKWFVLRRLQFVTPVVEPTHEKKVKVVIEPGVIKWKRRSSQDGIIRDRQKEELVGRECHPDGDGRDGGTSGHIF